MGYFIVVVSGAGAASAASAAAVVVVAVTVVSFTTSITFFNSFNCTDEFDLNFLPFFSPNHSLNLLVSMLGIVFHQSFS